MSSEYDNRDIDQFEDNLQNYEVVVSTVQSSAFRTMIEALKDILNDVNIIFDSTGMKILAMDSTHVALVHMKLYSQKFERFYCPKPKVCGISVMRLFKLLKTMTPSDTLTFFIEKNDANVLKIQIVTNEKNLRHTFELKLMDLCNDDDISIQQEDYSSVIRMPSADFQKLCRDMSQLAPNIEIKSCDNQLIFSVANEWVNQETVISETDSKVGKGLSYVQNLAPDEVIQGVFSLKFLCLFSKCTNLCPNIEVYLKNDHAMIIRYYVGNLGEIKFCLAPKQSNDDYE
jgi:proliferating cell nuclear antigen